MIRIYIHRHVTGLLSFQQHEYGIMCYVITNLQPYVPGPRFSVCMLSVYVC